MSPKPEPEELPIDLVKVSLRRLTSTDKIERDAEIDRLRTACESIGFFYLEDHGIPVEMRQRLFDVSRVFFKLPDDEKKAKWGQAAQVIEPRTVRGYVGLYDEQLNPEHDTDCKQFFEVGPDRPLIPGKPFTGPTIMPSDEECPGFRDANLNLLDHVIDNVVPPMLRAFALALGQRENFFEEQVTRDEMMVHQRLNYYPPHDGVAGRHTDSGLFTMVIQEPVESGSSSSLRVFSNDKWGNVEASNERIVVNLGNMLMFWSGGRFISTPHQVVHDKPHDRVSCPVFVYPNADARMQPIGSGEDSVKIAGEVYIKDQAEIFGNKKGAGAWSMKYRDSNSYKITD